MAKINCRVYICQPDIFKTKNQPDNEIHTKSHTVHLNNVERITGLNQNLKLWVLKDTIKKVKQITYKIIENTYKLYIYKELKSLYKELSQLNKDSLI